VDPLEAILGGSIKAIPDTQSAMREAGFQTDRNQRGFLPSDFKPMSNIGKAVAEIRIFDESGAFRLIFVAKFKDKVYILHCFQKKSQKTAKKDIDLALKRYTDLVKEISS